MSGAGPGELFEWGRELCTRSLRWFVRSGWGEIEPNALVWGWHMDAMCEHLQAVSEGQIRDLVIAVPPGLTKSLSTSTFWPAWDWIRNPTRRFLCATHGQALSEKNARLHRDLVKSQWYQERWGDRVRIGKDSVDQVREFRNTVGGWRFSTSVDGDAVGRHADVLLFDDLVKPQEINGNRYVDPKAVQAANGFWFETMQTRRANPKTTRRVGIAQRLHHDDTVGRCIEMGYTALVLPMEFDPRRRCRTVVKWVPPGKETREYFEDPRTEAGALLAPDRFPREVVEADRALLGPTAFEAQMNQNPTPQEGTILKGLLEVKRWVSVPEGARTIITVDCSFKDRKSSDFVCLQAWSVVRPNYYLRHQILGRMGIGGTMDAIREMQDLFPGAAVWVEDKANGPAVVEMLTGEIPGVNEWSPGTASKESRAEAVSHLFLHNVYFPPDDQAPWIGSYITTLSRFPFGRYDDEVDATTMALLILHEPKRERYRDAVAKMKRGQAGPVR